MLSKMSAYFCLVFLGVLAGCAGAKVGIVPNGGDGGRGGGGNAGSSGPTIDLDAKAPTPPAPVDQGASAYRVRQADGLRGFSVLPDQRSQIAYRDSQQSG